MELNLERPLLFFDIESTGLNIATDCIVELSFVKVFPGGEHRIKTWRFKPWDYEAGRQREMNPQASLVNGIKDEDLVNEPRFSEKADEIVSWLTDCDLAGFNSAKFDLPMLAEELERVRKYMHKDFPLNLHEAKMVDVQNIYHYMEPRNLKAAYRFYCGGKDFDNAHSAEADTIATYEVLKGQLDMYGDRIPKDVPSLSNMSGRPRTIDYAGRLIIGENGAAVISFGKHKGKTAREVFDKEPSYFAWIENGEFTLDTKRQFQILKEQFIAENRRKPARPATDEEIQELRKKFNSPKQGSLF